MTRGEADCAANHGQILTSFPCFCIYLDSQCNYIYMDATASFCKELPS